MTTKPTDYKAEAREWLGETFGTDVRWDGQDVASLAALLERLCGEAKQARDCHWWEQLCLADDVACDPLEVKRWVLQMHELAREEGWKAGMAEGQSIAFDRGKEEGRREQREKDGWIGCGCRSAFVNPTCTMHTRIRPAFFVEDEA